MDIRIRSNDELETQVSILKEYYGVKSKTGAIKKAVRDCAIVAEHKKQTDKLQDNINVCIEMQKNNNL